MHYTSPAAPAGDLRAVLGPRPSGGTAGGLPGLRRTRGNDGLEDLRCAYRRDRTAGRSAARGHRNRPFHTPAAPRHPRASQRRVGRRDREMSEHRRSPNAALDNLPGRERPQPTCRQGAEPRDKSSIGISWRINCARVGTSSWFGCVRVEDFVRTRQPGFQMS